MKPPILLVILLTFVHNAFSKNSEDSVFQRLNNVMDRRAYYSTVKENRMLKLKKMLLDKHITAERQYQINLRLGEEYKKYKADSAVFFIKKNKEIAKRTGNKRLEYEADIQLAWLYSTEGLYIESRELLDNIDRSSLPETLLPDYYESYLAFCSHYGQSNSNVIYYRKSEWYRDSLLSVLDSTSLKYQITAATKILYLGQNEEAEKKLLSLLEKTPDNKPERALIAYLLGIIYKDSGKIGLQQRYFAISAITDIVNAIKDNASLQSLALTYYDLGDIDQAYSFIQAAINDAIFCNVRYRTIESSSFYPIINSSFQEKERKQKAELRFYLILISLLSCILITGIVYIYVQMKKLSRIRKALSASNQQLSKLNDDLHQANNKLFESNHIKEEYIAHFFDLCSAYIDKLENYRKFLYKKAINGQLDSLIRDLKSTDLVETELEKLYESFDSIFLNLYPTFVAEFNSLLLPDEHVIPKNSDLLNTELRIFALVRLGINDSVKIASFLRYSLRTVYNYRTKMRNKAAVSRDEFEEQVKQIGTLRR